MSKDMNEKQNLDKKSPAGINQLQDKINERKRLEFMIEKKKKRTVFWFTVSAGLALLMVRPWAWKTTHAFRLFVPVFMREKLP
ncbi:hypothetical protein CHS0354_003193 [Potamilus streckersoni]|uniref:Uncharacterized protein n=1 Tax=Potamilus streckersoni TaxID=2493646 RepID=A0AAE0SQS9_9BIVA|nr:hypothetical protein CHS0354_003193 [Potamilus streckersoni]